MYDWSTRASVNGSRGGCSLDDANCRQLWELTTIFAPRRTLKAKLARIKNLFALDQRDFACSLTLELLEEHAYSGHVLNNSGVCALRSGELSRARELYTRASRAPGYEAFAQTPLTNLQTLDTWMAGFRVANGESREPSAFERGAVVASIMW